MEPNLPALPTPEGDDDWGAELFEVNGAPQELSAAERIRDLNSVTADAAVLFDDPRIVEALTILAFAVDALGGVLVIPKENLAQRFKLGIDVEYRRQTGGIRVYSMKQEEA